MRPLLGAAQLSLRLLLVPPLACRNFLRVQIRSYLQSHMQLPPKTVVLVARLLSEAEWAEVQAEPQQEGSAAGEAGPAEDDGKEGHSSEAAADSSSSNGLGIAALAQEGANQSHEQQQEEEQQQPQQPQGEEERRAAEQQARQEASVAPRLLLSTPFSVDSRVADMQPGVWLLHSWQPCWPLSGA